MLDPEYLLRVSEGGEDIAEQIHADILKKVVSRISARLARGDNYILTATDKWQLQVLHDAGYLLDDVKKILASSTGLMVDEIAQAMEEAGVRSMSYDQKVYEAAGLSPKPLEQSPNLIRMMQSAYEATLGEWKNFTATMAEEIQRQFLASCDKAYTQVLSGSMSYTQAYMEAIDDVITDCTKVKYPSGHEDTIETATLRCIRTGISQATAAITDARMDEMNWDIILVSAHLGARVNDREDFTNHYWWQGRFYSRSGNDKRFPPFSVCGYGNVQGIHGANCRHHHGPGDGEFNPYENYDSKENQRAYELQQKQRTMERRIRADKQKVMAWRESVDTAETPEAKAASQNKYQKASALLQKHNQEYNKFCEDNNLKKLGDRLKVTRWDRSQAAKARAAAKQFQERPNQSGKPIAFTRNNGKIKTMDVGKSLGAASKKYSVKMPGSRDHVRLAEGQSISGKTFAGNGTETEIREKFRLAVSYKKTADSFEKVSGNGYVIVQGKRRYAELHWYESENEVFEMKVKRFLDES